MTQNNAPSQLEFAPETSGEPDRQKAVWKQPEFRRIGVHEAEAGVNINLDGGSFS